MERNGIESVRKGRFSSYIALEFFDTVEKKSITCGVVFDSYEDAATDHMFFILQDIIPEEHFFAKGTKRPMDYKELKSYFASNYGASKFATYKESNKSYQNDFLAKMGGLKPKFFNLFKKSVTFTPISKMEQFISAYVCDVTDEIDIEKMQENIRYYKQLEKDAIIMEERKAELENIEGIFNSFQIDVQKEYMQNYLLKKSDLQIEINKLNEIVKRFEENTKKIAELEDKKRKKEKEKEELLKLQTNKIIEKENSDIGKKQKDIQNRLDKITKELDIIKSKEKELIQKFRNKIAKWRTNIKQLIEQKDIIQKPEILNIAEALADNIEYLLSINENNIDTFKEAYLVEMKEQMEKINEYANDTFSKNKIKELERIEIRENLTKEIENLKNGVKPYDNKLLEFKKILNGELEKKFDEKVDVEILADLLEIRDVKWKEAIECYINSQMFYLIVAPKYYNEAAKIYRKIAKDRNYSGFGIVDIEQIQNRHYISEKNSLAEEVTTDNQYAKVYIEYLLGKVIKCEETEEMRKYKSAITADCMLYKNFVLRNIADKYGKFKFIGTKSISEQIQIKEGKLKEILIELEDIEKIMNITKELRKEEKYTEAEIDYIIKDIERIKEKGQLIEADIKARKELNELDLTWIEKVEKEIENLGINIKNLEKEIEDISTNKTSIETTNKSIQEEKIPMYEISVSSKQNDIEFLFDEKWIKEFGNPKFENEAKNEKLEKIQRKAEEEINRLKNQKENKAKSLINARTAYVKKYDFSYDVTSIDTNEEYSKELNQIKEIKLPQYIDKIKDSKEKAYEQFREDFISKLKANIDEAENQIEELNTALKNSTFGTDKYHFTVKPKQEYRRFYDMIKDNMLMEGRNLWSEEFNKKYKDEIEELFKRLTSSNINDEINNKNIEIYTDYKTYLSFDLIVTDKEGRTQHLSRTLNKKSGGETQTPFYISILASFAQLYRINKSRNDNTLRLIVFDEAFSKMDEDRIEESLKLLPKFGFQAIIAAPSERLGLITPLVSNTLCVIKKGTRTTVSEWQKDNSYLG